MHIDIAKKLITALLFILIITLALTVFLLVKTEEGGEPAVTTDPSAATTEAPVTDASSTDAPSTDAPSTDAPSTNAPSTDGSAVTTPPATEPPVTTAPVTEPPVTDAPSGDGAPAGFSSETVLRSDSGLSSLDLRAVCQASANENGTVTLTVSLYLDHKSLYMGARNKCLLTVGSLSETFSTKRISQDGESLTEELLYTVSGVFAYGETVSVYAKVPVRLTYGGVEIDALIVDGSVELK